jgi:hypothetical protein
LLLFTDAKPQQKALLQRSNSKNLLAFFSFPPNNLMPLLMVTKVITTKMPIIPNRKPERSLNKSFLLKIAWEWLDKR